MFCVVISITLEENLGYEIYELCTEINTVYSPKL